MSPLAVIFDVDGVLVDSYQAHFLSWQELAGEVQQTLTEPQFRQTFGRTSREIIHSLWGKDLLTDERIAELDTRKEAAYREIVARNFPAMDGARELIMALSAAGFLLAVGSSGPPENVALAIDRLEVGQYMQARVTGRDVRRGKPAPDVFLLAAERLGVAPACCVVIEDAPVGVTAANAAGMTSIALLSGTAPQERLSHARQIVHSLRDVSPESVRALLA